MKTLTKISLALALLLATMLSFNSQAFCADFVSSDSYNKYLIESLNDENIGIRTSAATLLGERKAVDAVDPLIAMAKNEKNYSARIIAAIALYRIGDEKAMPILKKMAKKDKNKTVRHVLKGLIYELEATKLVAGL